MGKKLTQSGGRAYGYEFPFKTDRGVEPREYMDGVAFSCDVDDDPGDRDTPPSMDILNVECATPHDKIASWLKSELEQFEDDGIRVVTVPTAHDVANDMTRWLCTLAHLEPEDY